MTGVRIDEDGGIAHLVLERGRGNAMDPALLAAIESALDRLTRDGAPPVVLGSASGSFCTGLDLVHAAGLDREGMRALMTSFHRALRATFAYDGPMVAALGGHALAGGALLALCADARLMARGRARFGVHGVQLGVVYPDVAITVVRHVLSPRDRSRLLYEGRLVADGAALARGWVDELVDPEHLLERARSRARELAGPSPQAFRETKTHLRGPALEALAAIDDDGMDRWLDRWFADDTRQRLDRALLALRERSGPRPGEDPGHADRGAGPTEDER